MGVGRPGLWGVGLSPARAKAQSPVPSPIFILWGGGFFHRPPPSLSSVNEVGDGAKVIVMIFISILILIVAIALPSINKNISPLLLTRISSIVFIYAGALSLNALYIQSIGSGIGIYSGLFQITTVSQLIDTFIFF